jgi:triphosphatase
MGNEIELKFQVLPREFRRLKAARTLHRKSSTEEDLVSVYFDTPKHKLARNDVTLRVRRRGDKFFQTIKSGGSNGSFRRGEWVHEIKGAVPNLRQAHGTPLAPLLTKKLKRRLKPVFETWIHRTSIPVRKNRSQIEVALERGQIRWGRRSNPIGELELELKRGKVDEVFKLAQQLTKFVPATLLLKSKSEQGYDLIGRKETQPLLPRRSVFDAAPLQRKHSAPSAGPHCVKLLLMDPPSRTWSPKACTRCVSVSAGYAPPYHYSENCSATDRRSESSLN